MISAALTVAMLGADPVSGPRLVRSAPFPRLPGVLLDDRLASPGIAQSMSRLHGAQGRVMWVDATANMEAVDSREKVFALVRRLKEIGFNTIVYDVKPIIGYTMYPSSLTEQLTSWRNARFEPGYDPAKHFSDACREMGMPLYLALNAFSEGHRVVKDRPGEFRPQPNKVGWGIDHPELQTWQYVPTPTLALPRGGSVDLGDLPERMGPGGIGVFLQRPPADAAWHLALDRRGAVVSSGSEVPAVPAGGSVLSASAEAAERLKGWGVGSRPIFGSRPTFAPITERWTQFPLMMNPHRPENQSRAFSFITEILDRYEIDGVIYDDRLRFGGMNADFSPFTREKFEKRIGRSLKWPDDVFRFTFNHRLNRDAEGRAFSAVRPGPYFDEWMAWRARTMADFMRDLRRLVTGRDPRLQVGVYAGSWYGDYAQYGNNYGSDSLKAGFSFMTPAYRRSGFASQLDFLITGCYYPQPTMQAAIEQGLPPGRTVEAGGVLSNRVVRDQTWTYAGIMLSDFWGNPEGLSDALQAAAATTQGVMVFDLSHRFTEAEPILRRAFSDPKPAPHRIPGLLDQVRARRAAWDAKGWLPPAFPLLEGAPGAGF